MPLPICTTIPFGWRCLTWVEVMDKSQCNLKEVPSTVAKWSPTLRELCLDGNQITELNKGVMECYGLQKLSVNQNKLLRLPRTIKHLTMLQELYLADNGMPVFLPLKFAELSDLPIEMEHCINLRVLDLRLNVFTRLPSVLTHLASLLHLSLYDTALASLPNDFGKLTNLRFLDLRENQLRTLPAAIGQLKHLKYLDVGRNELVELPFTIGQLSEIEELYADNNYLTLLPIELVHCQRLQTLDISENEIRELPAEIGDLQNLTELTVSNNAISELPHSFERLTKLRSLSLCNNQLTKLTSAIGSCEALTELRLAKNKIKELPATIGDLKNLEILALDENQLAELLPAIGNCQNLKFLTIRNNELRELPIEIGRLENIRVIDVAENSLVYLPYTVSVLSKVRAIWLSIDQRAPMPKFTIAQIPVTHVKVLTCYLLPQGKCQAEFERRNSKSPYAVSFNDDAKDEGEELGQFHRKGTPHPKPRVRSSTPRKNNIDGRYIPHGENKDGTEQVKEPLKRKDAILKLEIRPSESNRSGDSHLERKEEKEMKEPETKPILRGVMHTKKGSAGCGKTKFFSISRDPKHGFGISIAGGLEAKPYKDGDTGIFISKVIVGSPAESAGLLPGDKIIFFNGVDVRSEYHMVVADMMRKIPALELVVLRGDVRKQESPRVVQTHSVMEVVLVNVPHEADGSLSFTLSTRQSGGLEKRKRTEEIIIGSLTSGGAAEVCGKIAVGDRVLSINGTNIAHYTLQQARSLLRSDDSNESFLVLQKESFSFNNIQHELSVIPSDSANVRETEKEEPKNEDSSTTKNDSDNGEALLNPTEIAFRHLMVDPKKSENEYIDFAQMKATGNSEKRQGPPVPPKPSGKPIKLAEGPDVHNNSCDCCNGSSVNGITNCGSNTSSGILNAKISSANGMVSTSFNEEMQFKSSSYVIQINTDMDGSTAERNQDIAGIAAVKNAGKPLTEISVEKGFVKTETVMEQMHQNDDCFGNVSEEIEYTPEHKGNENVSMRISEH